MKPLKSKSQIRKELAEEVSAFLNTGGAVKAIPTGVSGNEKNTNMFRQHSSLEPRQERTPLNDVVQDLDNRKSNKNSKKMVSKTQQRPRKKMITDDFGEPLRWVWEE